MGTTRYCAPKYPHLATRIDACDAVRETVDCVCDDLLPGMDSSTGMLFRLIGRRGATRTDRLS